MKRKPITPRRPRQGNVARAKTDAIDFGKAVSGYTPVGLVINTYNLAESGQRLAKSAPKAARSLRRKAARVIKRRLRM